jgi:salicylate hydroxylase
MSAGPAAASLSIGIIGAGIGGLTAANALIRRGFKNVRVYDQASHFVATAGAGFGFSPNGQMCLTSIGINDYKAILHPFHNLRRIDRVGDIQLTSTLFKQLLDKYGFSIAGCLRADLVTVLASPLDGNIHYSQKLTSLRQDSNKVYASFESGLCEEFDLVIGADGIRSFVSDALQIDSTPSLYSGANIFYGVLPNPDSIDFIHPSLRHMDNTVRFLLKTKTENLVIYPKLVTLFFS